MSRTVRSQARFHNRTDYPFTVDWPGGFGGGRETHTLYPGDEYLFSTDGHEVNDKHYYSFELVIHGKGDRTAKINWWIAAEGGDHGIKGAGLNRDQCENIQDMDITFSREGSHDSYSLMTVFVSGMAKRQW